VSLNATTVGNGATQPFHAELMALNARNVGAHTNLSIIGTWHGVARLMIKLTLPA